MGLKIYAARLVEGQWINVEELPFNSTKFSSCHPTLSKDETKLYFASDRPGGFGGMDIYVSVLKNGVWSEPENLGVNVNSAGNELFPFVDDEGNLYLSSDGTGTLGRLDIFKAEKDGKRFSKRKNIGEPFNTRSDDFAFFIDKNKKQGFLSSNRLGGHGSDDLYGWRLTKTNVEEGMTRKIIVVEEGTGKRIEEAEVAIEQELGDWKRTVLDEEEAGAFVYQVKNSEEYFLNVSSNGFVEYNTVFDQKQLLEKEEIIVPLKKKTFSLLSGKVEGQIYHNALKGVEIELLNECNGERSYAKSSADGSFGFTIMCGCEYIVIAKKDGFMTSSKIISKDETPCENTQLVERKIQLRPVPNSNYPRASAF
ncbi:MAG TPA: hypothetical protein ENJ53_09790 [Phaeodactylibacter sp.]|nr:hypothetical protein [Phaeodactylibacter sp.]